jgi:hypothetical protein
MDALFRQDTRYAKLFRPLFIEKIEKIEKTAQKAKPLVY